MFSLIYSFFAGVIALALVGFVSKVNATDSVNDPNLDDYRTVIERAGGSIPGGTTVSFQKNNDDYIWKFDIAGVPLPDNARIYEVKPFNRDVYYIIDENKLICTMHIEQSSALNKTNHQVAPTIDDYYTIVKSALSPIKPNEQKAFEKVGVKFIWTFNAAGCESLTNNAFVYKHMPSFQSMPANARLFYLFDSRYVVHAEFSIQKKVAIINLSDVVSSSVGSVNPLALVAEVKPENKSVPSKKTGIINYFIKKFGKYPPALQQWYRDSEFVLSTLHPTQVCEKDHPGNTPHKKQRTRTTISNGMIFYDDFPLTTENLGIWVMDKKGALYYSPCSDPSDGGVCHHSYILKSKPESPHYGFGKPIACGGCIQVVDGKIKQIDSETGHYRVNEDQFLVVAHHLYKLGVFTDNAEIKAFINDNLSKHYTPAMIALINPEEILAKYQPLEPLED